ncbi:hypothetical protein KQX54_001443, partial [Cotesia glomerata]
MKRRYHEIIPRNCRSSLVFRGGAISVIARTFLGPSGFPARRLRDLSTPYSASENATFRDSVSGSPHEVGILIPIYTTLIKQHAKIRTKKIFLVLFEPFARMQWARDSGFGRSFSDIWAKKDEDAPKYRHNHNKAIYNKLKI